MTKTRQIFLVLLLAASAGPLQSQSLLDRPPNLSGGWLGAPGTVQFNFVHRFTVSPAPERKVANSPTFLFSYRLPIPVMLGINYATSSDIVGGGSRPNEFEPFLRYGRAGPFQLGAQLGYNNAAKSVDGELTLARTIQRLRVMAVGRAFSHAYGVDTARFAVGGGAVLRLGRWVALAGDVSTLLERRAGEKAAWGAGLQLAIPYSPHTLSLQVANTNTGTLEGTSRGITGKARGGFEFTIPFTLSRYFGKRRATASAPNGGVRGTGPGAAGEMRTMTFSPKRIEIAAGGAVTWTNNDQLVHTVSADDGSWDSGPVEPGKTWSHTFTAAGDYAFHCTPHPFMKGVVHVR
ncbi:MAG: cupredoxin family copper-binding protein [Gemmatimonadales bacterium]